MSIFPNFFGPWLDEVRGIFISFSVDFFVLASKNGTGLETPRPTRLDDLPGAAEHRGVQRAEARVRDEDGHHDGEAAVELARECERNRVRRDQLRGRECREKGGIRQQIHGRADACAFSGGARLDLWGIGIGESGFRIRFFGGSRFTFLETF